jgi:YVTN family beta-propeller protein
VSGWAFTRNPDAEIDRVLLRIDGDTPTEVGEEIPCCSARPDVSEAFPAVAPPNTGFGGLINFNRIPSGARTIGVEIRDTADPVESRIFDHEVSVVRLGDAELLDDFTLTEESSVTVTGSLLTLQDVDIRAKGEDETMTVDAGFIWNESCQCFLPWPLCGNGGRDVGEECDGEALGELSCQVLGFGEGNLSCFRDEETDHDFCLLDTGECEEGDGAKAYVTLVNDNAVAVLSTSTNTIIDTDPEVDGVQHIPVGDRPRGIAISPDGREAYVANAGNNTVSVIDTATKAVVDTITVGHEPQGVAFAPDGATVYVTNIKDNTVSVIDTATRTQTTTIAVGRSPQSIAVAVTPHGPRAYVPNFDDDTVTVVDLTTLTPLSDPLVVGEGPLGVAASVDGMRVYVTNFGATDTDKGDDNGDTVSFIDTEKNEVVDTNPDEDGVQHLQVGVEPAGVAVIPETALELVKRELKVDAFVANFLDATISVITEEDIHPELNTPSFNVAFNPRFNAVDNEPYAIAITPNGLRGYATLFGSRKDEGEVVQVFSTLGQQVVTTIEVGRKPFAIAIGPQ